MSRSSKQRRAARKRSLSRRTLDTVDGEFIGTKLSRDGHVTIWIEGRDTDGPSVSGTQLDRAKLDQLVMRLGNLREHMP